MMYHVLQCVEIHTFVQYHSLDTLVVYQTNNTTPINNAALNTFSHSVITCPTVCNLGYPLVYPWLLQCTLCAPLITEGKPK